MKVYKINLAVDDFKSLLAADDAVHGRRLLALEGKAKADNWGESLEAVFDNAEAPTPDIFSCGAGNMLLWGRSLQILEPIVAPIAELLPVVWEGGNGRLVNVVGLSDCLDLEHTTWHRDEDSGKKLFIEKHAFIPQRLPRVVPFRFQAQRFATFCADYEDGSDGFRTVVDSHGLTGVKFETVWQA